jgi:hypothetical protein
MNYRGARPHRSDRFEEPKTTFDRGCHQDISEDRRFPAQKLRKLLADMTSEDSSWYQDRPR